MDKTSLENSIQSECDKAISDIREEEAQAIRRLDIECQAAIDSIRKLAADETDAQIRRETVRLENRDSLERRKLQLQRLEDFILRQVEDVMTGVRRHPGYRQFLLDAVSGSLAQISGRAEVRLASDDLALKEEIHATVRNDHLDITDDPAIRWGGCLVVDEDGGRIFNSTLERTYFRKSAAIRRRVAKILEEQEQGKNIKEGI